MPNSISLNLSALAWLADAPLFADDDHIRAFYDAVVRPEFESDEITLSFSKTKQIDMTITGSTGGTVELGTFLKMIFPGMDAKASASGKGSISKKNSSGSEQSIKMKPINTPQRQLIQLALHYAANFENRLIITDCPSDERFRNPKFVSELPRALVFLDFPKETKFIPMMVEVPNGEVVDIFKVLKSALHNRITGWPPEEPNPANFKTRQETLTAWGAYWKWYSDSFDSLKAITVIEEQIKNGGGRIRWIDYRVPLAAKSSEDYTSNKPLHLHLCGREKYDTGIFAYNMVKRGYSHGLRLVGTLMSDSIDVLAVFNK